MFSIFDSKKQLELLGLQTTYKGIIAYSRNTKLTEKIVKIQINLRISIKTIKLFMITVQESPNKILKYE